MAVAGTRRRTATPTNGHGGLLIPNTANENGCSGPEEGRGALPKYSRLTSVNSYDSRVLFLSLITAARVHADALNVYRSYAAASA